MTPIMMLIASLPLVCEGLGERPNIPRNFVFFAREHQRIAEASFLTHERVAGAQLTYTWRELEPERDRYDLQPMREHLAFLERHGKRLFVQLQDVSFSQRIFVPEYLTTDTAFHGGAARTYEGDGERARFAGWAARRWDPETGARVTVAELYRFATDRVRLDYIFWGTQEPYYSTEILPYLRGLHVR
jgi:hypothetical protein